MFKHANFPPTRGLRPRPRHTRDRSCCRRHLCPRVQCRSRQDPPPLLPVYFSSSPLSDLPGLPSGPPQWCHLPRPRSMAPAGIPGSPAQGAAAAARAACALGAAPAASSSPPPDRMLAGRPRPALRAPGIDPSTPRPLRRRCPGPALASATPCFPAPSCWASRDSLTAHTLWCRARVTDLPGPLSFACPPLKSGKLTTSLPSQTVSVGTALGLLRPTFLALSLSPLPEVLS